MKKTHDTVTLSSHNERYNKLDCCGDIRNNVIKGFEVTSISKENKLIIAFLRDKVL
jgi:hypothetical protein